jgi:hypothetical protein
MLSLRTIRRSPVALYTDRARYIDVSDGMVSVAIEVDDDGGEVASVLTTAAEFGRGDVEVAATSDSLEKADLSTEAAR